MKAIGINGEKGEPLSGGNSGGCRRRQKGEPKNKKKNGEGRGR